MDKNRIKCLVMDVDGTLTDGKIYMGQSGEVYKSFSIKDGYGIHDILIPSGIKPIIITGRCSDIVSNRCKELGIWDVYQGVHDKTNKLMEIVESLATVAYIGDDINDLGPMQMVKTAGGIIGCPADAVITIKNIVNYISPNNGGEGAVRDFIEFIVSQKR